MIRAVLDTNILVSAFFWGGVPRLVIDAARENQYRLVTSEILIAELLDVVSRRKFAVRLQAIAETSESLIEDGYRTLAEVVEPAPLQPIIKDDPDDDHLIACAIGDNTNYIVSGDHHLLELGTYQTIKMVTVNQFVLENLERE